MVSSCDQQYVQRVAATALPRCRELSLLLSSSVPAEEAMATLCTSSPCLAALRDIRAIGLGDCALSSAVNASAVSLQRDVVDVCLTASDGASASANATALDSTKLNTGAAVGLSLTLVAVVMALVLVCAWVRRSRRKHPLQLLSPTKKRSKRTNNGVAGSGIGNDVPYITIELSEEELRLQARKK
jgi:hypothetical protein